MKRMLIAAAMLGVLSIGTRAEPLALEQQTAPETQRLQQRVDELEKEVARLKRELATRPIYSMAPKPANAPLFQPYRIPSPGEPALPPGGERRDFNGVPYYVIPVDLKEERPHLQSGDIHTILKDASRQSFPVEIVPPEILNPSK